jgi:trans-aconitate 2-methyltransferase
MTTPARQSVAWSARQYVAFEDERTRPVRDLLAAVPAIEPRNAIDIGCGPGNSTELLARRFPNATVSGLDSSPDMVAAARERLPALDFSVADLEEWVRRPVAPEDPAPNNPPPDVILANAVLQWSPDHAQIFPALRRKLAPGGVLAVQMPDNLDEPAHCLMREVAQSGPWAVKLSEATAQRASLGSAAWYYELLHSTGCRVDVWRTTYYHALAGGAAAVVEWFKGSGLRPFLAPLDADERSEFLLRYHAVVGEAYPPQADGSVLLPFPRLFIVAVG